MIVVRVELWPKGDEAKARPLGMVFVANDGTSRVRARGSYDVRAWGKKNRPLRRAGRVENFPRRSRTVFDLLRRALGALGYE